MFDMYEDEDALRQERAIAACEGRLWSCLYVIMPYFPWFRVCA